MIATGIISYSVHVHCPHCKNRLELNEYPYADGGEYEHGEDRQVNAHSEHQLAKQKHVEVRSLLPEPKEHFVATGQAVVPHPESDEPIVRPWGARFVLRLASPRAVPARPFL